MAQIVLQDVCKTFSGARGEPVRAVDGVNLDIQEGEFFVLVGPSGCGKSTVLRLIAGLEVPSVGHVRIAGRVVNQVAPRDRDVAMVFQNHALYPHLNAFDNMAFGLKLRKLPKPEIERRVREAAAILRLGELLDRLPQTLSGGQRQRVAVGRAIVRQPSAFLFDEPLANLDAALRIQMRLELVQLHRRLATTMVYVTHDQTEAMAMGDRIAVMNRGRLLQTADPLMLYRHPANLFVAGFIGSPPMNLLPGRFRLGPAGPLFEAEAAAGDPAWTAGALPLPTEAAARLASRGHRPVVLGVRPEDTRLWRPEAPGQPPSTLAASVELVERLGPETLVHLQAGPHRLVARVGGAESLEPHQAVRVALERDRLHLFDPVTEQALL